MTDVNAPALGRSRTPVVDGRPVRSVNQAPQYPMQFMLGIYEFGGLAPSNSPYPKRFTIDSFRAYRPVGTA